MADQELARHGGVQDETGERPLRSVGITDLIAYRECPRRASYGVRRHTGEIGGQDPDRRTPEAGSRAAAYGSCVHDALAALEEGHDDETAIQVAWNRWGRWLQPDDLALLREDLVQFRRRDFPNTRTVLSEDEIRIPLLLGDGKLAFFRARIDRLYERVDRPGSFILVDYKSSRWARSDEEVQADLQLWAYDWAAHEHLPEIEDLVCIYDQLRYGQIPARKTDKQREQMRDWLVTQMTAYFADTDYQGDGLLAPRYNQWCPWCPIMESCPVIGELSDFALTRLQALSGEDLAAQGLEPYSELYSVAKLAGKVLKRFTESMNDVARELPADERSQLGYSIVERRNTNFPPAALARLQERLGQERFLELVSMPKKRLESLDEETREWALSLAEAAAPSQVISRKEPGS